jgi:putative transposase
MSNPPPHRKRVQHYDRPGHAHELTFSCYDRRPLLADDHLKRLFSHSIDQATENHGFDLVAFVYMPEHVHLLVFPLSPEAEIEGLLYAIKRPFSYRVKQHLIQAGSPLVNELTIRERPGKQAFRFWQEGGGYDRNLVHLGSLLASAEYIHRNPVRRGLCSSPEQWKWSSWFFYHLSQPAQDSDLPKVHGPPR